MPLRIELAPNERLILGGVSLRNGPRRAEFIIETHTKVLRERDIITEREADTPARRLYLTLEDAYLSADPTPGEARFMAQANEIMAAAPSTAPLIAEIFAFILEREHYRALKSAKKLIAYEAEMLARARANAAAPGADAA